MKQRFKHLVGILACSVLLILPPAIYAAANVSETIGWYNTDKTITINPGADDVDGSGTKEAQYKLNDGEWISYTDPIVLSETTIVSMRSVDHAGNYSDWRIVTVQIDKSAPTAPEITPSALISNQDITFTITDGADPDGSGTEKSQYQIQSADATADETAWLDYTEPQTVSEEGRYTIYARTFDMAGNISAVASLTIEIDTLPPDKIIITPPNGGISNDDITITLPTVEGYTYGYQVVAADTPYIDEAWQQVIDGSITITDEGVWDLYVKTTDQAGNSSISAPCRIIIDRTAPAINTVTKSTDTYTDAPVTVTIEATDNIQIVGYTFDGGITWLRENFYAYADNIIINANDLQVKDIGGNITTYADAGGNDIEINTIGKVPPAKPGIEGDYNSSDSVDIEVDISDPALSYTYQIVPANDGYTDDAWQAVPETGMIHFDQEGIWHLYLRVNDGISFVVSDPILIVIDKTPPTAPAVTEDKAASTVKVLVADGSDALSGVKVTHIFVNGEDKTVESKMRSAVREFVFNTPGKYEIKAQTEDMVGNLSPEATHTTTVSVPDSGSDSGSDDSNGKDDNKNNTTTIYDGAFSGGTDGNGAALMLKPNIKVKSDTRISGYIGGYEDNTFRPSRPITKAEYAAILNRIISINQINLPSKVAPGYVDVTPMHWAYHDINTLQRLDIIPTQGSYFYPDENISREEISASLDRVLNLSKYSATTKDLKDIQSCTYQGSVAKVYNAGLVVGYEDKTFKPTNSLTRAECVSMLNRTFGFRDDAAKTAKNFKDVHEANWYYSEVRAAAIK